MRKTLIIEDCIAKKLELFFNSEKSVHPQSDLADTNAIQSSSSQRIVLMIINEAYTD